ncbi:MAG: hypothetical protein AAB401_07270 [Acidobacteriota bacterium]|mgnify:CR=1 FL=1
MAGVFSFEIGCSQKRTGQRTETGYNPRAIQQGQQGFNKRSIGRGKLEFRWVDRALDRFAYECMAYRKGSKKSNWQF